MQHNKERFYTTAIRIEKGIVLLITPDGDLAFFRQRGIEKLNEQELYREIVMGRLDKRYKKYPEVPKNWSISFEDNKMGRARVNYKVG